VTQVAASCRMIVDDGDREYVLLGPGPAMGVRRVFDLESKQHGATTPEIIAFRVTAK
jgi:hypothetical protein